VDHLGHPEDLLVKSDPLVHVAELDVADDVIDREQSRALVRCVRRLDCAVAGQVRPFVTVAADEGMHDVAVRRDRRQHDLAEVVLDELGLAHAARTALDRFLVGVSGVRDTQRDVLDAVAVLVRVIADLVTGMERAREHEADVALLENVARAIPYARLWACVRRAAEAECVLVVIGGLLGVPDPELDVIPSVDGHEVFGHGGSLTGRSRIGLDHGDLVQTASKRLLLDPGDGDQPDDKSYAGHEQEGRMKRI